MSLVRLPLPYCSSWNDQSLNCLPGDMPIELLSCRGGSGQTAHDWLNRETLEESLQLYLASTSSKEDAADE